MLLRPLPVLSVLFALLLPALATAAATSTVEVHAALVGQDMEVHLVPLHPLALVSAAGDTMRGRTDTNGHVTFTAGPGIHTLSSLAGATFDGKTYRWTMLVDITAGVARTIDLTNDNATVETNEPVLVPAQSASEVFRASGASVFRIEAALSHGSGFLADTLDGVILTNAHVVEQADSSEIYAVLDRHTRVRAQVLAIDASADVAVLRVHSSFLTGRHRIPLQHPLAGAIVSPGERVLALGYPLHQELTITSGIASSAHDGALISDVSTSPGNSGGPMFNAAGEAIAINTFRDASRGSGVAGAVLVERAGEALRLATSARTRQALPSLERLACIPEGRFDMNALTVFIESIAPKNYPQFEDLSVGGFDVSIWSPTQALIRAKQYDDEFATGRRRREQSANIPLAQRYRALRVFRMWEAFVGDLATPIVSISVIPRSQKLLTANDYHFTGDVRDVQVFRNDTLVVPLRGGHEAMRWDTVKDVADMGAYAFDPAMLRPDASGAPPSIVIAIRDLKNPQKARCSELPANLVAAVWNGFQPYFQTRGEGFTPADAAATSHRKAAWRQPGAKNDCDWTILSAGPDPSGMKVTR